MRYVEICIFYIVTLASSFNANSLKQFMFLQGLSIPRIMDQMTILITKSVNHLMRLI